MILAEIRELFKFWDPTKDRIGEEKTGAQLIKVYISYIRQTTTKEPPLPGPTITDDADPL